VIATPMQPARVSLSVSPAHVTLAAGTRTAVHVEAGARAGMILRTSVAGFTLDLRGRPRIVPSTDAASWLTLTPRRVRVGAIGATVIISSRRPSAARPGDHSAIVLLTTTAPSAKGMVLRMRIGLVVTVRVKGRLVRNLVVASARSRHAVRGVRGASIDVALANRGNVIESIDGNRLRVVLLRRGRVVARLRPGRRKVLPRTSALVAMRYRGKLRGAVTARVELTRADGAVARRSFRLRL
jgi:hypothetical protein